MTLKQRLQDWAEAQATDCSLDLEALEQILTRKLSTDAAYTLGEEAFRAGYEACLKHIVEDATQPYWVAAMQEAWSDFEPSEDVKRLIG